METRTKIRGRYNHKLIIQLGINLIDIKSEDNVVRNGRLFVNIKGILTPLLELRAEKDRLKEIRTKRVRRVDHRNISD